MHDLYNQSIKDKYLSQFPEKTAITYKRIFVASKETEEYLEKDLFNFNTSEVKDLMYAMNPSSLIAARINLSVIENYIDWAIDRDFRGTNLSPVRNTIADLSEFVTAPELSFFSYDQFIRDISMLVNFQDKVIPALLFEGIDGGELSELVNLKKEDVNIETKTLILTNNKGKVRCMEVSEFTLRIIQGAMGEKTYFNKNGEAKSSKLPPDVKLNVDSDYVIRTKQTKRSTNAPTNKITVRARLSDMKDYTTQESFTATNIMRSGMIYMGKHLLERDGKLEKEQWLEIAEKFDAGYIDYAGKRVRNITYIKEVATVENVKMLYPEVISSTI